MRRRESFVRINTVTILLLRRRMSSLAGQGGQPTAAQRCLDSPYSCVTYFSGGNFRQVCVRWAPVRGDHPHNYVLATGTKGSNSSVYCQIRTTVYSRKTRRKNIISEFSDMHLDIVIPILWSTTGFEINQPQVVTALPFCACQNNSDGSVLPSRICSKLPQLLSWFCFYCIAKWMRNIL